MRTDQTFEELDQSERADLRRRIEAAVALLGHVSVR